MLNKCVNIAIIFTCHNRVDKTKKCIESLMNQECSYITDLDYYICDDGSTDGTTDEIRKLLPNANIIQGNGELYWTRGMYKAMSLAREKKHDFYLMVNDDVEFYRTAFQLLFDSYIEFESINTKINSFCGIVGSTYSEKNKNVSYGGWNYIRKLKIGACKLAPPSCTIQRCDLANWNCFIIPEQIVERIGIIDPYYQHSKGDFDYSMMMKRYGFPIYISKGYVGMAENDHKDEDNKDKMLSRKERFLKLNSIKGVPFRMEFYYFVKNWGFLGFMFFFYSYSKTIWNKVIK